jgi:hypothetical protein
MTFALLLDMVRPRWRHSDVNIRLEAVRSLGEDDVAALTQVAREDPEASLRVTAIRRLTDAELLGGLAQEAPTPRNAPPPPSGWS